nr:DUF6121 family protein [Microbacterium bovistercoris]
MSGALGGPGRAPTPSGGGVPPLIALAFATVLFGALVIGGLGGTSLLTGRDVISAPGFGQFPGVAGVVAAIVAFALVLWAALRQPRPSFWAGVWAAAACTIVYLAAVWVAGAVQTGDVVLPASVVERLVTGGFIFVVAGAALVAGWGGVALARSRGGRPRWPWEDDESP